MVLPSFSLLLFFLTSFSYLSSPAPTFPSNITLGIDNAQTPGIDLNAITCRWSNCNQLCAPGYRTVPRAGGNPGEMMWDHTHCNGKGDQQLCCPSDSPLPSCVWRGHKNSGHCVPGCEPNEREVGTLGFECKTGHQSACCKSSIAVEEYGVCKWFGSAPLCSRSQKPGEPSHALCGPGYPNFLFASSLGFGGEKRCESGAKSYCCNYIPSAFENCRWYTKETHQFEEGVCEPSCPPGQIKLGMQQGDCPAGEGAYCCAGKSAPPPTPPPPRPDWEIRVQKFEDAAHWYNKYYGTDECPDDQKPPLIDPEVWPTEVDSLSSEGETSIEMTTVDSPAGSCKANWTLLSTMSLNILRDYSVTPRTEQDTKMIDIWDGVIAQWRAGATYADLHDYLVHHPSFNPSAVIQEALYDMKVWRNDLAYWKKLQPLICRPPSTTPTKAEEFVTESLNFEEYNNTRALNSSVDVRPRYVNKDLDPPVHGAPFLPVPHAGLIIRGILLGHLTLHYARWFHYVASTGNFPAGPTLELAYWIGTTPDQRSQAEEQALGLDNYRDTRPNRPQNDLRTRWVVFHLHFDERDVARPWLFVPGPNGDTYVGISAINVFHSAVARTINPYEWIVDGTRSKKANAPNTRSHIRCDPNADGSRNLIYAGPQPAHQDELSQWLSNLYNDGYLGLRGFGPIMDYPQLRNENRSQLSIHQNDILFRPETHAPEYPGQIFVQFPWQRPFLIDGTRYNTNIPPPSARDFISPSPIPIITPTPKPRAGTFDDKTQSSG